MGNQSGRPRGTYRVEDHVPARTVAKWSVDWAGYMGPGQDKAGPQGLHFDAAAMSELGLAADKGEAKLQTAAYAVLEAIEKEERARAASCRWRVSRPTC